MKLWRFQVFSRGLFLRSRALRKPLLPLGKFALIAALLALAVSAVPGHADKDQDAALAMLKALGAKTDLETPGVAPWYVKIEAQSFTLSPNPKAKSTPGERGTIQEIWASPTMYHIIYNFPSYQASEGSNAQGFYRSGDFKQPPLQLEMVRRQIVHPTPTTGELFDTKVELRRQTFGAKDMACVIVGRPVLGKPFPPIGHFPAFCAKAGATDLDATFDFGGEYIQGVNPTAFEGRSVPGGVVALVGEQTAALGKVSKLAAVPLPLHDVDFAAPEGATQLGTLPALAVSNADAAKHLQHKEGVRLDDGLTIAKVSGNDFTARVLIGRDGKVVAASPFGVSVQPIVNSCLTAIKGYTYKPWEMDGKPVEVETTVTIVL